MSWRDFLSSNTGSTTEDRYIRINPNIGSKPPELDAISQMESLRDDTRRALRRERLTIQDVGRSLISSSFYFDMTNPPSPEGATRFKCTGNKPMTPLQYVDLSICWPCKGRILCRLGGYLRAFGDYFLLQQRPGFQPYFEISEDTYHAPKQQVFICSHPPPLQPADMENS